MILTNDAKATLVNDLINVLRMDVIQHSDAEQIEEIIRLAVLREAGQTGDLIEVLRKYEAAKTAKQRPS